VLLYRQECFSGKKTTHKVHMKLHPELEWRIFHILTSEDINDIIFHFNNVVCAKKLKNTLAYIIKRKLHVGLKIWFLFSHEKKTIFYLFAVLVHQILFLPLKNKIHIFAPPCNILYV